MIRSNKNSTSHDLGRSSPSTASNTCSNFKIGVSVFFLIFVHYVTSFGCDALGTHSYRYQNVHYVVQRYSPSIQFIDRLSSPRMDSFFLYSHPQQHLTDQEDQLLFGNPHDIHHLPPQKTPQQPQETFKFDSAIHNHMHVSSTTNATPSPATNTTTTTTTANPTKSQRHTSRTGILSPSMTRTKSINPLDFSIHNPLINQLHTMRGVVQSCPELWSYLAQYNPQGRAVYDAHHCDEDTIEYTFQEMNRQVLHSAFIFRSLGVVKGRNVAIFGENSAYWLLCDHGIQLAGGASAVRGADASPDELRYIYNHSDSAGIVVLQGPKLLQRLIQDANKKGLGITSPLGLENQSYGPVRTILLMHREGKTVEEIQSIVQSMGESWSQKVQVYVWKDLLEMASATSTMTSQPISSSSSSLRYSSLVIPKDKESLPIISTNDVSTIVYTSGTTGKPKGVMLTHGNLLHQIGHRLSPSTQYDDGEPLPGELMLALLPVWHITERTFELWMISRGCCVVYSSIRTFKEDLALHKPQWLVLVPRVLEKIANGVQDKFSSSSNVIKALVKVFTAVGGLKASLSKVSQGLVVGDDKPTTLKMLVNQAISVALSPFHVLGNKLIWSKVQDGFGGRVKVIICGGSALASSLETFYEICGVPICVGYGLTECSPLLSHRRKDRNLVAGGCVGLPCIDTEIRIVDPELNPNTIRGERPSLPLGQVGLIVARGPQITKGYYNNVEATSKAIDAYGFFDTGDLGKINPATGDLIITGRCKDTIVLSNGENIEPSPIEDAIMGQVPMVHQVMLTGQDGRSLTAILVLSPTELVNAGYLDSKVGKLLQKENERVNDPKCSEVDCGNGCKVLNDASKELRKNVALRNTLIDEIRIALKDFRKWEQVGNIFITLEPFAICNSLLTQSYKVKRDSVLKRYKEEL